MQKISKKQNFASVSENSFIDRGAIAADDDIFKENPFSDEEPTSNAEDIISQKQIEEIMTAPQDYQSGSTQFELIEEEEAKEAKREFFPF